MNFKYLNVLCFAIKASWPNFQNVILKPPPLNPLPPAITFPLAMDPHSPSQPYQKVAAGISYIFYEFLKSKMFQEETKTNTEQVYLNHTHR